MKASKKISLRRRFLKKLSREENVENISKWINVSGDFNAGAWNRLRLDAPQGIYWSLFVLVAAFLAVYGPTLDIYRAINQSIFPHGDSLFNDSVIVRIREGWYWENQRAGFPFGSQLYDFPIADIGSFTYIWLLTRFGISVAGVANLFYFTGFLLALISSQVLFRSFGIRKQLAFTLAALYSLSFYHFARFSHLFLTWYWVIPLYVYLAFRVGRGDFPKLSEFRSRANIGLLLFATFLSLFGTYYMVFGTLSVCAMWVFSRALGLKNHFSQLLSFLATQASGFILALLPSIVFIFFEGKNNSVAQRNASESDWAGFHLPQLFIPRPDHVYLRFANFTKQYNQQPFVNENQTATLGILASLGLLIAGYIIWKRFFSRSQISQDSVLVASLTIFAVALGASGGFGTVLAYAVTPQIRSWNRISIEIACLGLLLIGIAFENFFRTPKLRQKKFWIFAITVCILFVGVIDQVPIKTKSIVVSSESKNNTDVEFVQKLDFSLPKNSSVYQMPYMSFPEEPPVYNLPDYGLLLGFNNSTNLNWSYGAIRQRGADLFFKKLSKLSIQAQVEAAHKLGFVGIYVDLRGYKNALDTTAEFLKSGYFDTPVSSSTGEKLFLEFKSPKTISFEGLSLQEKLRKANYLVNRD